MSLRGRLLLAVGAVALVALVVADVATYSALRSFLYQRVDQTLDSAHRILESGVDVRGGGIYYEVRDDAGNVLRHGGAGRFGAEYTPKLPGHITGLSGGAATTAFGPGPGGPETRRHLVVHSSESGGPRFRVLATSLAGGGQLIVATPLNEVAGTLHRL